MTVPSQQNKLPHTGFPLLQMQQDGTLGAKMPWQQTTSIKEGATFIKKCTPNWATVGEVQMPT